MDYNTRTARTYITDEFDSRKVRFKIFYFKNMYKFAFVMLFIN